MNQFVLQSPAQRDKLIVKAGYLVCPRCRRNKKLLKLDPETTAQHLVLYCRDCKQEIVVNIEQGQCFESRRQ